MLSASFTSGSQSFEVRPAIPFCWQHQIPGKTKPRANRVLRARRARGTLLGFPWGKTAKRHEDSRQYFRLFLKTAGCHVGGESARGLILNRRCGRNGWCSWVSNAWGHGAPSPKSKESALSGSRNLDNIGPALVGLRNVVWLSPLMVRLQFSDCAKPIFLR